jgi:hypothetical protein
MLILQILLVKFVKVTNSVAACEGITAQSPPSYLILKSLLLIKISADRVILTIHFTITSYIFKTCNTCRESLATINNYRKEATVLHDFGIVEQDIINKYIITIKTHCCKTPLQNLLKALDLTNP